MTMRRPALTSASIILLAIAVSLISLSAGIAASAPSLKGVKIAVTVDDIPEHGDDIPGLSREQISRGVLAALKENQIPAFGFSNGAFMQDNPEEINIFKEWLTAGYPLGNHTYSHPDLDKLTAEAFIAEIAKQDKLLLTLRSFSPLIQRRHVFRYPFLSEGNTLAKRNAVRDYLRQHGYRIAEVTVDYYDWAWTDAYSRCLGRHDEKSVQWMKDHVEDSADRYLLAASQTAKLLLGHDIPHILLVHIGSFDAITLGGIFKHWQSQGVQFVSLDDALADPAYSVNPNMAFDGGRSFLEQIAESRHVDISQFEDQKYTMGRLNDVCKSSGSTTH
jgi:peptidoglycan-N-acetylglucosamine deacetylase